MLASLSGRKSWAARAIIALTAWAFLAGAFADETKQRGRRPSGQIDNDDLIDLVDELGYEYELFEANDGTEYPRLQFEQQEGWFFPINVFLSSDKSILWLTQGLQVVPEDADDAAVFLKALEANGAYGPPMFSIVPETRMLQMNQGVRNDGLDADALEEIITAFASVVEQTQPLWSFEVAVEEEEEEPPRRRRRSSSDEADE